MRKNLSNALFAVGVLAVFAGIILIPLLPYIIALHFAIKFW